MRGIFVIINVVTDTPAAPARSKTPPPAAVDLAAARTSNSVPRLCRMRSTPFPLALALPSYYKYLACLSRTKIVNGRFARAPCARAPPSFPTATVHPVRGRALAWRFDRRSMIMLKTRGAKHVTTPQQHPIRKHPIRKRRTKHTNTHNHLPVPRLQSVECVGEIVLNVLRNQYGPPGENLVHPAPSQPASQPPRPKTMSSPRRTHVAGSDTRKHWQIYILSHVGRRCLDADDRQHYAAEFINSGRNTFTYNIVQRHA